MINRIELGSRRVLKPGKLRWLRAIAWAIVLGAAVVVVASLAAGLVFAVHGLLGGKWQPAFTEAGPVTLVAMTLMALTSLGVYVGLVLIGEDRMPSELALRPALPEVVAGLAIGAAMMSITVLIMWAAGWILIDRQPITSAWGAVAMAVQSGVVEEVVFRLVVLRLLWRAFGPWAALGLSAFLFGALHISNPNANWFAALCIMVEAGIMLAGFYILTGRLWVSIGVHAGWNFSQGWIFGAAVSGTDLFRGGPLSLLPNPEVATILSGGNFGPEASVAGLLIGTLVGALTMWLAWTRGRFIAREDDREMKPPQPAVSAAP